MFRKLSIEGRNTRLDASRSNTVLLHLAIKKLLGGMILQPISPYTHISRAVMQRKFHTECCSIKFTVWRTSTATRTLRYFSLSADGWHLSVPTGSTNFSVDSRHLSVANDNKISLHTVYISLFQLSVDTSISVGSQYLCVSVDSRYLSILGDSRHFYFN